MSGRYKLVHYVPNPFSGARFAVGAFVEADGNFSVELAKLPAASCLGGKSELAALKMMLSSLSRSGNFAALPETIGPYASLTEAREIPRGVGDSRAWVSRHLRKRENRAGNGRVDRRVAGSQFFKENGVSDCVHSLFKPSESAFWAERLSQAAPLGSVSHWVEGPKQLWLLEPIVLTGNRPEKEVPKVARLLGAYRGLMERQRLTSDVYLVAYLLGHGDDGLRHRTMEELAPFATNVVDTAMPDLRHEFVSDIRRVSGLAAPLN